MIEEINSLREKIRGFIQVEHGEEIPEINVLEAQDCDGYTRQHIEYNTGDGDRIPAFMLVPNNDEPHPGIIVFHQHNSQWHLGKNEVVGLGGSKYQAFGPELARRGICVLAPDSVGFEERYRVPGDSPWNRKTL